MTEAEARALLPELSSSDPNRRLDAASKLRMPGWTFAVPELMRLAASEPDHRVRRAAISALGIIGDLAAYALLESIWKNPGECQDIRSEALKACDRMLGLDDSGENGDDGATGTPGAPGDGF